MTEISFARSFLSALDARPIKLSSDHVSDAKKLTGSFVYTLPRYPNAPSFSSPPSTLAPTDGNASADSASLTQISLRNLKSPAFSLTTALPADETSVYDLKSTYSTRFTVPAEKIKVLDLSNKRPIADSKLVSEFVGDKNEVEFGVMLLGGVTPTEPTAATATSAATAATAAEITEETKEEDVEMKDADSTKDVLATEEFWTELKEWLVGKVGKEEGQKLAGTFKKAAGR